MTQHPAWLLIVGGSVLLVLGLLWLIGPPVPWLGRLPGDVRIERENVRVYVPIASCLLVSLLLTGLLQLVRYFSR